MGFSGSFTAFILFTLYFIGSYKLVTKLPGSGTGKGVLLIIILLLAIFSVLGILFDQSWGWTFTLITFALGLAHLLWLFTHNGMTFTLAATLAVSTFSILIGLLMLNMWEPPEEQEKKPSAQENKKEITKKANPIKKSAKRKKTHK
jgi:hypothetical protein